MAAKTSVKDMFKAIEAYYNQPNPLKVSDLENLFTKDFKLERNGAVLSEGLNAYVAYVEKLRGQYTKTKFILSNEEPVASGKKIAVEYTMNLAPKSGGSKEVSIVFMATFTFEGDKVARWRQVANEKGHTAL